VEHKVVDNHKTRWSGPDRRMETQEQRIRRIELVECWPQSCRALLVATGKEGGVAGTQSPGHQKTKLNYPYTMNTTWEPGSETERSHHCYLPQQAKGKGGKTDKA